LFGLRQAIPNAHDVTRAEDGPLFANPQAVDESTVECVGVPDLKHALLFFVFHQRMPPGDERLLLLGWILDGRAADDKA